MPSLTRSAYGYSIRLIGRDHYRLSWTVDRKYADSRLRYPTTTTRDTDEAGAHRFAKKMGRADAAAQSVSITPIRNPDMSLAPLTAEQIADRERTRPRTFDLTNPKELERLLRETVGYAKVSLHYGTDDEGRRYAYEALDRALRAGYRLVPPASN